MSQTQVLLTTYRVPTSSAKGLSVNTCACGDHVWCLPYNESLVRWESHQRSPFRDLIEKKGFAPPEPRISHHVILASPEDAHLVTSRKWRPMPTKVRTRHKVELKGGSRRGLALQRLIMGREACTRFLNGYGCDVRRANLRRMTRKEITADWRARKAAQTAAA
jgi:hypothetical protein